MSVFEKIAFLESLIKRINDQIKVWDNLDASHQIDVMPVFYN